MGLVRELLALGYGFLVFANHSNKFQLSSKQTNFGCT